MWFELDLPQTTASCGYGAKWKETHISQKHTKLVGGLNPSEKYEFVNWDDEIPNINGKMPKIDGNQSPPTRKHTKTGR